MPKSAVADPSQGSHAALTTAALTTSSIRPIGVYVLAGLASDPAVAISTSDSTHPHLMAIDTLRGYLVDIDLANDNTTILNPHHVKDWIGATGLAVEAETLWFIRGKSVFECVRSQLIPSEFVEMPFEATGVAVDDMRVYVTCEKSGYIHIFDKNSGQPLNKIPQPGIGSEHITLTEKGLWVCDQAEQTVYCLDPETGDIRLSALTPFGSPTGIAFCASTSERGPDGGADEEPTCYLSYADEEAYIRDDPNAADPFQLTFRDRTFIHPLYLHHNTEAHYTLSNGYLAEISYVEELLPLDAVSLDNVEWRIALPADTPRQKVRHVEPIGHPFTEEIQAGQRVAVYRFDTLKPFQAGLVGWKATVEMYSIKYTLTPQTVEAAPPLPESFQAKYLIDDDELSMDTETIKLAAKEAVGTETNLLRKALKIRNYVYDRLSYGIQPKIDTPDIALERGIASCGEYVGILLALFRLNGIACRTIGRYKCPKTPELRNVPLSPDFNHVWLEFYIPDIGWLPMESNVDDTTDGGPYPNRFFMGLAWYHAELGKGIPFAKLNADNRPEKFSLGNLAVNHIRFTILDELNPEHSV